MAAPEACLSMLWLLHSYSSVVAAACHRQGQECPDTGAAGTPATGAETACPCQLACNLKRSNPPIPPRPSHLWLHDGRISLRQYRPFVLSPRCDNGLSKPPATSTLGRNLIELKMYLVYWRQFLGVPLTI